MPVLLLPPRYSDDSNNLRRVALAEGWEVERLQRWRLPQGLDVADVVVYGEPLFCEYVAQELSLALLEPPFDWPAQLPAHLARREITYMTLAEARSIEKTSFVKPAEEKSFPAKVYANGAAIPHLRGISEECTVLVATPVVWEVEFRCFVCEGKVETLSPYIRNGDLAQAEDGSWPSSAQEQEDALAFAQRVLDDPAISLPPAVVLDVGLIQEEGWAVVETNAAWASGLCGSSPSAVLRVLRHACKPHHSLSPHDKAWLPQRHSS